MPLILTDRGFLEDPEEEVSALERLAVDLRLIANGEGPGEQELSGAPLLDHWQEAVTLCPQLMGVVHGHPLLRGPIIGTSQLWALAPDRGLARTMSRFYRLGRSRGTTDAS